MYHFLMLLHLSVRFIHWFYRNMKKAPKTSRNLFNSSVTPKKGYNTQAKGNLTMIEFLIIVFYNKML